MELPNSSIVETLESLGLLVIDNIAAFTVSQQLSPSQPVCFSFLHLDNLFLANSSVFHYNSSVQYFLDISSTGNVNIYVSLFFFFCKI